MTTAPRLGIWVDDSPATLLMDSFWRDLNELGFRTVALMQETVARGFDPKYSIVDLKHVRDRALGHDMEVVLTVWPEPRPEYLEQLDAMIDAMIDAAGASALEYDRESNWIPAKVGEHGYRSLEEAADAFSEFDDRLRARKDVRTEETTFTMHAENSRRARAALRVDRLLAQAYSVRERSDGPVAWEASFGPGGMQRLTLDRTRDAIAAAGRSDGKPALCVGLAAYDQQWPGRTGEEAMRVARDAALAYSPIETRYWSSKWVVGAHRNGYSARFFRSLLAAK